MIKDINVGPEMPVLSSLALLLLPGRVSALGEVLSCESRCRSVSFTDEKSVICTCFENEFSSLISNMLV
jgi:hypothetical protein